MTQFTGISIHAPRTGSDQVEPLPATSRCTFQSTLPARGATIYTDGHHAGKAISIHAPRTGSDERVASAARGADDFNPRSPHGERLGVSVSEIPTSTFQSTLPARGATLHCLLRHADAKFQSTLPARGATAFVPHILSRGRNFNPRSPHGERHHLRFAQIVSEVDFNPRSPHGERRARSRRAADSLQHFNPRSPHGERRTAKVMNPRFLRISIHAPRTGSDACSSPSISPSACISIHAPRTGSDIAVSTVAARTICYFNPRSPHGERRIARVMTSTVSYLISIHAPRTGSD